MGNMLRANRISILTKSYTKFKFYSKFVQNLIENQTLYQIGTAATGGLMEYVIEHGSWVPGFQRKVGMSSSPPELWTLRDGLNLAEDFHNRCQEMDFSRAVDFLNGTMDSTHRLPVLISDCRTLLHQCHVS